MEDKEASQKLIDRCKGSLYSAVIADTLDSLGYHNQIVRPGLKPLTSESVLCGFARVGLYMPVYHDDEEMRVYENEIALVDSLKPGDVPVLICHGNLRISPWGELLSERSVFLGAAGCLTDGCVRDARQIQDLNFPIFCGGTNPADTKYRGKMIMSDVPGEIGGVSVARGDMVFGDVDGIVIVPSSKINEVVKKSLEKVSKENIVRKEIRAGHALVDIFAKHKIL